MRIFSKKFIDYAENTYFREQQKNIKSSSYHNFIYLYKNFIRPYWQNTYLKNITNQQVQKFYENLALKENLSEATIQRGILALFRAICNHAIRNDEMQPVKFILKKPQELKNRTSLKRDKIMKESNYEILVNILKQPLGGILYRKSKIFTVIALCEGLRIGEICALKWGNIDFDNKLINIDGTVNRIYDAENNKTFVNISTPKTEASIRSVPMLDLTYKKLVEFKEISMGLLDASYKNADFNQFYVLGGVAPSEPRTIRACYKRFLEKHNIEYINPHALRHTFCTNAIDKGCQINAISKILGHSNSTITMNVYNHLTERSKKETVDILNKTLGI